MASYALRQAVRSLLVSSPVLAGYDYIEESILPNFTPDGVKANRFMVLRWGNTVRGIGSVNRTLLVCAVYNREPDFVPIVAAIKEVKRLLQTLVAVRLDEEAAVLDVFWEGDTGDTYDDGYRAYYRTTDHTITASGS